MSIFFDGEKVTAVKGAKPLKFLFKLAQLPTALATGALVTSVQVNQQPKLQLQQSLNNSVYLYSLGEKLGAGSIGGMIMQNCSAGDSKDANSKQVAGLVAMQDFYRTRIIAADAGSTNDTVLALQLGGIVYDIVILSFNFALDTAALPSGLKIITWSMNFATLPNYVLSSEGIIPDVVSDASLPGGANFLDPTEDPPLLLIPAASTITARDALDSMVAASDLITNPYSPANPAPTTMDWSDLAEGYSDARNS